MNTVGASILILTERTTDNGPRATPFASELPFLLSGEIRLQAVTKSFQRNRKTQRPRVSRDPRKAMRKGSESGRRRKRQPNGDNKTLPRISLNVHSSPTFRWNHRLNRFPGYGRYNQMMLKVFLSDPKNVFSAHLSDQLRIFFSIAKSKAKNLP